MHQVKRTLGNHYTRIVALSLSFQIVILLAVTLLLPNSSKSCCSSTFTWIITFYSFVQISVIPPLPIIRPLFPAKKSLSDLEGSHKTISFIIIDVFMLSLLTFSKRSNQFNLCGILVCSIPFDTSGVNS